MLPMPDGYHEIELVMVAVQETAGSSGAAATLLGLDGGWMGLSHFSTCQVLVPLSNKV